MRPIRPFVPLSGLLVGLLAGCDPAGSVDPASDQVMSGSRSSARTQYKSFRAQYTWRIVGQAPSPGCDGPGEARSFLEGEGRGKHLGRFTITLNHCGKPNLPLSDGHGTFIAANGDLLHITYFGVGGLTGAPPVFGFESRVEFVGGTGKFSGATGTATVLGTLDVRTLSGTGDWSGIIKLLRGAGREEDD
jgi:hypothetical protein